MQKPQAGDYNPYFQRYIDLIHREPLKELLRSMHMMQALLTTISEEQGEYRYAEGKWSVKEVLMHIIDVERVMAYRALCASRGDKQQLPPFDDQEYVAHSGVAQRSLESLLEEHQAVRLASIKLLEGLSNEMLDCRGNSGNHFITARAIAFIIAGHEQHHFGVLQERYVGKITA